MVLRIPICFSCVHYKSRATERGSCAACPEGIPDEVYDARHCPGRNGIAFERIIREYSKRDEELAMLEFLESIPDFIKEKPDNAPKS